MVVAYDMEFPTLIVDLLYELATWALENEAAVASQELAIAKDRYKPSEYQEVQMTQNKNVEWIDSKLISENLQRKTNIAELNFGYSSTFLKLVAQFSFTWDGELDRNSNALYKI